MTHANEIDAATRQQLREEAEPLLTPRQFQVFCRHFGLDGEPPQELTTIATEFEVSVATIKGHWQDACLRFTRPWEHVLPRERVRRALLVGLPIAADFLAFHAQLDAEQIYASQPNLAEVDLVGSLSPNSIYPLSNNRAISRPYRPRIRRSARGHTHSRHTWRTSSR
ncbi:MAG: hypothetical protein H0X24_00835 [Ktedonobacterales bacterium]|nr:hypothetical protein [Ktedonobacterales bacterium]